MVEYAIFMNGNRKPKMKIQEYFEDGSMRLIDGSISEKNEILEIIKRKTNKNIAVLCVLLEQTKEQ